MLAVDKGVSMRSIEDFENLRQIGLGKSSRVYEARHKVSKEMFAIKICQKTNLDKKAKHLILNEKKSLTLLRNKSNIIQLQSCFQDPKCVYFVIQKANGSVSEYLRRLGRFPTSLMVCFLADLVLALAHMREARVVHRDIKPDNILLDQNRHVLLSDFGGSKIVETESGFDSPISDVRNSETQFLTGTMNYMPPEALQQKMGIEESSERTVETPTDDWPLSQFSFDLWSLGCVAFQLLSGEVPFQGMSREELTSGIILGRLSYSPDWDPNACHLVQSLLKLNPRDRLGFEDPLDILKHPFFDQSPMYIDLASVYVPTVTEAATELASASLAPYEFTPEIGRSFRASYL